MPPITEAFELEKNVRFFVRSWCKRVGFFGKFFFGVFFLYVCTCEARTIHSTFDFIDPFETEKFRFPRHVCFQPWFSEILFD